METGRSPLTLDEALPIIAESITEDTVLVGGQAINLWAVLLEIETASPFLTRDIDLIGNRSDAILANKNIHLPHTLYLTNLDDASINAAIIEVTFPGDEQSRPIDYLMTLYGLDRDKIVASAIEVEINSLVIRVIHPILLMQSKVCNLSLPSKQTPEAIEQSSLSIEIVSAFLKSTIQNQEINPRKNLKLFKHVINFAKSQHAVDAYHNFQTNVLQAIPTETLSTRTEVEYINFLKKGFPNALKQVDKFRY